MKLDFVFLFNGILLGIGLAMDAFSVSLANGLNEPRMKLKKSVGIALVFGVFQGIMPFFGWLCVNTVASHFKAFQKLVPFIALFLLLFIGGKMILEGIHCKEEYCKSEPLGFFAVIVQGVATSIDALSVGFTIEKYSVAQAALTALIIAFITFLLCFLGVYVGKNAGERLFGKAGILGGAILVFIGIEIFITGIL